MLGGPKVENQAFFFSHQNFALYLSMLSQYERSFQTGKLFNRKAYELSDELSFIKKLKIFVRELTKEDIKNRKLPNQTTGLVITQIKSDSPLINTIEIDSIILEVQKKKIKSAKDLELIINQAIKSNQNTILIAIINQQNQRRYIGVKLD